MRPGQSRFPVDVLIRYAVLTAVVKCVYVHTVDMWLKDPVSCVCNQKGVARRLAVGSLVNSPASVTWRISLLTIILIIITPNSNDSY